MTGETPWQDYEQVAVFLLDQVAEALGLQWVEPKQKLIGKSGTTWEVDGKGVKSDDGGFVVLECRRYTRGRLPQEHAAALAYRIRDTGASGGIFVSPLGLQAGAAKVASAEGIQTVVLDPDSSTTAYMLQFLNHTFIGVEDSMGLTDEAQVVLIKRENSRHQ